MNKDLRYRDEAWLREQYEVLGRSSTSIAIEVGVGANTILYMLKKYQITVRSNSDTRRKVDDQVCVDLYNSGMSIKAIALHFNVTRSPINNCLARNGVDRGPLKCNFREPNHRRRPAELRATIANNYKNGVPRIDIGTQYNVSDTLITQVAKEAGLPLRRLGNVAKTAICDIIPTRPTHLSAKAKPGWFHAVELANRMETPDANPPPQNNDVGDR